MFTHKKKLLSSLLITLVASSSFIEAAAPEQPLELSSTKISCSPSAVRLSFLDESNNEDNFTATITEYNNPSNSWTITIPGQSTSPYGYIDILTGIDDVDKIYQATVVASNADGDSLPSNTNTFRMTSTFGCDNNGSTDVPEAPGPYIGVSPIIDPVTLEKSKTDVRINFEDNSDNESGFKIFGDINMSLPANDETATSQVYKTITGLTCDKVYQIKALAYNTKGDSLPSDNRAFNIHSTFSIDCEGNNTAPIADAGIDQNVDESTQVQLDGSGSSDADGDPLDYNWTLIKKPTGSTATLSDRTAINPTFVADVIGSYKIQLIVNDGQEDSIADTVTIIASLKRHKELTICNVWSVSNSGGVEGTNDLWDISQIPEGASFDFEFDAYYVPDKFRVDYNNTVKLQTGWRGGYTPDNEPLEGPGRFDKYGLFTKGNPDTMSVIVTGGQAGTAWEYRVRCIDPQN